MKVERKKLKRIVTNRLNEIIGKTGKPISQIACDAGIEPRTLYKHVNQKGCLPSAETLVKLSIALNVSIDWLCGMDLL